MKFKLGKEFGGLGIIVRPKAFSGKKVSSIRTYGIKALRLWVMVVY